jgi:Domain of unknown function (DUF4082)
MRIPSSFGCLALAALAACADVAPTTDTSQAVGTPVSLFSSTTVPAIPVVADAAGVELGVKFRVGVAGKITAVRFYRGAAIAAGYRVNLWDGAGTQLATAQLIEGQGPTPSWQQASFAPVAVTPGQVYVASYFASEGNYAAQNHGFASEIRNGNLLVAPASSAILGGNGVYAYGSTSSFPTSTYQETNYFVDVVFVPDTAADVPRAPTNLVATAINANEIDLSYQVSTAGNGESTHNVASHKIFRDGQLIATIPGTYNFYRDTLVDPQTTHVYTVVGSEGPGNDGPASQPATATTPAQRTLADCPCSLFGPSVGPAFENADTTAAELGIRFRASADGVITHIRYYKGSTDPGPNVGHLWTANGTLIATATATTPPPAFGWATLTFAQPIPITHGTTYVASFFAPQGRYGITPQYFSSFFQPNVSNNPLFTDDGSASAVRRLGSTGFPSEVWLQTNFWVDVVFAPTATAGPQTLFGDAVPPSTATTDTAAVELGVKFQSAVAGKITAVRFYRSVPESAGFRVSLWSTTGTRLGEANAVEVSFPTPGWQQISLVPPVQVAANTTYIASYFALHGGYSYASHGFDTPVMSGVLTAPDSTSSGGNGVYRYASTSSFPDATFASTNYFVDVVFEPN